MPAPVRNLVGGVAWATLALCLGASWLFASPAAADAPVIVGKVMAGQGSSCAVTTEGAVRCWGWNYYGQLGVGTSTGPQSCNSSILIACSTTPVAVGGLASGVSAMGSGYAHTCALTTAGGVRCWGYAAAGNLGNGSSTGPQQCGQGPTACSTSPVAVGGLDGPASALAVGWNHSCVVTNGGGVDCWGGQSDGALGNGVTTGVSATPVAVDLPNGVTVTAIGAGERFACAVTSTGGVLCWGSNRFGQLGNGTSEGPQQCGSNQHGCSAAPVAVDLPSGVTATAVALGGYHACALTSAGGVLCWGWNSDGQLGNGIDDGPESCSDLSADACSTTPVAVNGLNGNVVAISAGERHTCALTSAGQAQCWGDNSADQLGLGPGAGPELCGPASSSCSTAPATVSGLSSGASGVAAGWDHSCALTSAGGVKCWGENSNGGLGTGNLLGNSTPVQVLGLPGAWTLSVSVGGAGSGTVSSTPAGIDCGGVGHTACSASFAAGSTVQLRSSTGAGLAGFAGAGCAAAASTCDVTMSSERSVTATFALPPSASISAPAGGGTYAVGEPVATSFACVEGASGPGIASCDDSGGVLTASGGSGQLDTSTPGLHVYTVTAVSKDGLAHSTSIAYRVVSPAPPSDPGDPSPEAKLSLSLSVETRSLRELLRTGKLVVVARVDRAAKVALTGRAKLKIRVNRKTPTKLVTVFRHKTPRFSRSGSKKVTLTLTKKGRRALRSLRRVRLSIAGVATDTAGTTAKQMATLTLQRPRRP